MKRYISVVFLTIFILTSWCEAWSSYDKKCEKELRKRYREVTYLPHSDCYLVTSKSDKKRVGVADSKAIEIVGPYYAKCLFERSEDGDVIIFALNPDYKAPKQGNTVVSLTKGEILNMGSLEPMLIEGKYITSYGQPIYDMKGRMVLDCNQSNCLTIRRGSKVIGYKLTLSSRINGAIVEQMMLCDKEMNPLFTIDESGYMWKVEEGVDDHNQFIWVCTKGENTSKKEVRRYSERGELIDNVGIEGSQLASASGLSENKGSESSSIVTASSSSLKKEEPKTLASIRNKSMSDIDINVPMTKEIAENTFAVIISNENYSEVEDVPYALNDGESMSTYCKKVLGIPESNVHHIKNATLGQMKRQLHWLEQISEAYGRDAKIIFYYSGHGMPDEKTREAFLLPIDGFYSDMSTNMSINDLYKSLGELNVGQVTVFMDACFSGSQRGDNMLVAARGVKMKAKSPNCKNGNLVVMSAAQGDETAYPYHDKQHGLFTYFLLKKLKESGASVNLGELTDYVISNVKKASLQQIEKIQTPEVSCSIGIQTEWRDKTL